MPSISAQQIRHFEDDGFLVLRDVLTSADLQPLISDIESVVEERVAALEQLDGSQRFEAAPFETRLHEIESGTGEGIAIRKAVTGKHLKSAGLVSLAANERLLDVIEGLIGTEILFHPQYNVQAKMPHEHRSQIPWHQDLNFLDREAENTFMVNTWTPLVDVTSDNGCLEMIRGSHRAGLRKHTQSTAHPEGHVGIAEEALPPGERILCPANKGDVVLFQHRTIHRSLPNRSAKIRWSVDLRYCDPRQPTGRAVPGLLVRSRLRPEDITTSHLHWQALMASVPDQPYLC